MLQVVLKRSYLVRFQDGLYKEISSNQLVIVVIRSEVEEEIELRQVEMIPEVREEFGCYHWVYIHLHFIKQDGLYKKEDQVSVYPEPDEEDIQDVELDDDRERHWCMVFQDKILKGGWDEGPYTQRSPAQHVPFDLIIWYIAKTIPTL